MSRAETVVGICVLVGGLCLAMGCKPSVHPASGEGGVAAPLVVEDHSEVLIDWLKHSFRNRVVVAVDAHDDLRPIPEEKIAELRRLAAAGAWDTIAARRDIGIKSLFMKGDYLYAAHRLGVLRQLYWVVTPQVLTETELANGGQSLIRAYGFPETEAATFRRAGNTVRGSLFGVDVTISTIASLPPIDEAVLLTVDTDYVSMDLRRTGNSGLESVLQLCRGIAENGLRIQHGSVAYSVQGNYTRVIERHHGDEILLLLHQPHLLRTDLPQLWRLRDYAFTRFRKGQVTHALAAFDEALKTFPRDPSLLAGRAFALAASGQDEEAFAALALASENSPPYDYSFVNIGKMLAGRGEHARAHAYLAEFVRRHPSSFHGLMAYGDFLYNASEYEQALAAYHQVLNHFLEVNAVMYAGDTFMRLGRIQEANMYYTKGRELLEQSGHRSLDDFPQSARYMKLLKIYL